MDTFFYVFYLFAGYHLMSTRWSKSNEIGLLLPS